MHKGVYRYSIAILLLVILSLANYFYHRVSRVKLTIDPVKESWRAELGYLKRKYVEDTGQILNVDSPWLTSIFLVTATFHRAEQKSELTRMCNTLLLVPNCHWIVIEDAQRKTDLVTNLLAKCGVKYTHLNVPTPPDEGDVFGGRAQRNLGLQWIRGNANLPTANAVVYIADDDNSYSPQLFDVMRDTERVSVWPVGLAGGLMVEKPEVKKDPKSGQPKVVGWDVTYAPERKFALDMAGFAINLNLFLSRPKANFDGFEGNVKKGHEETYFLDYLVSDLTELEPKLCNEVRVWHTQALPPPVDLESTRELPSDIGIEVWITQIRLQSAYSTTRIAKKNYIFHPVQEMVFDLDNNVKNNAYSYKILC